MNFKRLSLLAGLLILGLLLGPAPRVSAHVLASDNDITVELHIPPNDKPVAGQATVLRFTFEDPQPGFEVKECGCKLQVFQGPRMIAAVTPKLNTESADSVVAAVTFPEAGTYRLRFSGYVDNTHEKRFNVGYTTRIIPAPPVASPMARTVSLVLIGLCCLVAVLVTGYHNIPYFKRSKTQ